VALRKVSGQVEQVMRRSIPQCDHCDLVMLKSAENRRKAFGEVVGIEHDQNAARAASELDRGNEVLGGADSGNDDRV
jgi:hypothetical protein